MGGEAAYRFALILPGFFAAVSPLAGFNPKHSPAALQGGCSPLPLPLKNLRGVPVWAISGAEDIVVPLSVVQAAIDELKAAGVDIRLRLSWKATTTTSGRTPTLIRSITNGSCNINATKTRCSPAVRRAAPQIGRRTIRILFFAALAGIFCLHGCASASPNRATPKPGWTVYANDLYGYEIQYPQGYALWPTGPEGGRDGANIRIALADRAAPAPVLDIRISPRTPESEFPGPAASSGQFQAEANEVLIGGRPAREWILFWKSTGEIAFVEILADGVVFQFAAGPGPADFHASEWRQIVATFRLTGG
ncbi:MAG: hypothetical protein JW929_06180 [Anaerolineales bacterium]|nr:hypothetical protein [Anaerolineales bacterium]